MDVHDGGQAARGDGDAGLHLLVQLPKNVNVTLRKWHPLQKEIDGLDHGVDAAVAIGFQSFSRSILEVEPRKDLEMAHEVGFNSISIWLSIVHGEFLNSTEKDPVIAEHRCFLEIKERIF
jgi:hypothetical protein